MFHNTLATLDEDTISSLPDMAWASPLYSRSQIDVAGRVLARDDSPEVSASGDNLLTDDVPYDRWAEFEIALTAINNWRSSHSFPLNTLQVGLRRLASQVDVHSVVAQRIKRLSSIEAKLRRFPTMKLSQMQDIGGCRAVVRSVRHVNAIVAFFRASNIKHKLDHLDNYIEKPQLSGYRGVHLIWRYYSDKNSTYNGLKIEMQLRSPLQHAWATAVETVGTFIRQALKSSQGEAEWLRFVALMGTALAYRERTNPVAGTPSNKRELIRELRRAAKKLDVENRLTSYGQALQVLGQPDAKTAHFFLLALNPKARSVRITGYRASELETANKEYISVERSGADAVLVSVESLSLLRRAYPNYFLDTRVFLNALRRVTG